VNKLIIKIKQKKKKNKRKKKKKEDKRKTGKIIWEIIFLPWVSTIKNPEECDEDEALLEIFGGLDGIS
jgi:hypothetical protein